jgi:hypothetical protein
MAGVAIGRKPEARSQKPEAVCAPTTIYHACRDVVGVLNEKRSDVIETANRSVESGAQDKVG